MSQTSPTQKLTQLMHALAAQGIDLFLVPMEDEFQGEYIHPSSARLPFISGFTGSAGLGVIRAGADKRHVLFVDGRYTIQAAQEVDSAQFEIINIGDTSFTQWLEREALSGMRIGFDPWLVTEQRLQQWKKTSPQKQLEWVALPQNPIDAIWSDRPALPAGDVELHPLAYAGASYADKRIGLIQAMQSHGADAMLLSLPDSINWLLNIRGSDIPFNPLLLSFMILQSDGKSILYSYGRSFSDDVNHYWLENGVTTRDVREIFNGDCKDLQKAARVMLDAQTTPHGWVMLLEKMGCVPVMAEDATALPKAAKNAVELQGIRAAHRRDGLALTRFLHWFDTRTEQKKYPEELEVVAKLESIRALDNAYRGPSFATIAGAGAHGAIVHYRADAQSNRRVNPGELFLLDSGGQYADGTTDVTRTMAVGVPSSAQREHFTRVLKGHIALASATFPAGTSGVQLDVLARQHLWEAGLDYDHGTGHGVGAYLCVHEGPQRISKRGSAVALVEGMIISNEPGYYLPGEYGIRIESLVAVVKLGAMSHGVARLGFETLTLAPIDTRLINVALLNDAERNWLNTYHQRVFKAHEAGLEHNERQWLMRATKAI